MPILNIVLRGDLSSQRIKFDRSYKFRTLKLLHIYHNINSKAFSTTQHRPELDTPSSLLTKDTKIKDHQRLLFAKLSFINHDNSQTLFIEPNSNAGLQSALTITDNHICLGQAKHNSSNELQFKDLYKVLVDDIPKEVNGQFKVELSCLSSTGQMVRLHPADFKTSGSEQSILVMTLEFTE